MSELFGAPSGIRAAEEDMRANAMTALALNKGAVELEGAQLALSSQRQMIELMRGLDAKGSEASSVDPADDMAGKMDLLASMALKSGLPTDAREYANTGSTLRHNASLVATAKANYNIKNLNTLASLLDGVQNEREWHQANAMFQVTTGQESPYARMPYNPVMVKRLQEGIVSAKDKAQIDAARARIKSSEAEEMDRKARLPLIEAQTELARQRTENLKKTGAVGAIVKAADLRMVTDLAAVDFDTASSAELRVLSRDVAARGLDLIRSQNLTREEAFAKAYEEAKADGVYGGLRTTRISAGSMKKPLEIPLVKGKPDKAAMKPNMFYTVNGKTMYWTGEGFLPAGQKPGEISDDSILEEGEDDLEEEEEE